MKRQRLVLALWLMVMAAGARAVSPAPPDDPPWGTLRVPGGFAALQQAVNLAAPADEWRTIPLVIEMSFAGFEGLRHSRAIQAYASTLRLGHEKRTEGEGLPMTAADSIAPLPLGSAFWETRFEPVPPPHDMLWAILSSREMSALYYGLLGFDDDTLRAVQADAALSRALVRHALVLPTVAPALRVTNGRIDPPAGADAALLWEDLVGKRLDQPADFVNALLRRDDGRMAHFYATIAALPTHTAQFVTGVWLPSSTDRNEVFKRFYGSFQAALGDWRADALIEPSSPGPAEVLFSLRVGSGGVIAGAPWRDFWSRAFGSDAWPADPARELGPIRPAGLLDPATLLEAVCPGRCDPVRLAALGLVQREFPVVDVSAAPALLAVVRARVRYPALALEIQRMALGDPQVFVELGGMAAALDRLGGPARALALVQFQSAVALLARMRALGAPAALVREHLGRLAALEVTDEGFDGTLIGWLTGTPSSVFGTASGATVDGVAERALAGAGWQAADVRLEWEGMSYRVDIAATERTRIREMRSKFASNALGPAAAMARLAEDLLEAVEANRIPGWLADVEAAALAAHDVGTVSWSGAPTAVQSVRELHASIRSALTRAGPADRRAIEPAARQLRGAADLVATDALAALVYATSLHNTASGFAVSTELPRRHRLEARATGTAPSSPWDIPRDQDPDDGRRFISGSLLGLDIAITDFGIQRMGMDRPKEEPNMNFPLAKGLWRAAALARPWSVAPGEIAAVEQARARGVAAMEGWRGAGLDDAPLRQAGVAGPRAGWVRWLLSRGESPASVLTLEHLVRLGGWPDATLPGLGAAPPASMCLCLVRPEISWDMRGRPRDPETALATLVEPSLRVAVELERRRLPAALAPGVLALMTTDIIEQFTFPHPLDLEGVGEVLRRLPPERFDDYIAAVAARGPLVRIEEEGAQPR